MAERPRRTCVDSALHVQTMSPAGGKERVHCRANQISENLPVGWKAKIEAGSFAGKAAADVGGGGKVCYTTSDGTVLRSPSQARSYLASCKKMEADDAEEILAALVWSEDRVRRVILEKSASGAASSPAGIATSACAAKRTLSMKDKVMGKDLTEERRANGAVAHSKSVEETAQEAARKRPRLEEDDEDGERGGAKGGGAGGARGGGSSKEGAAKSKKTAIGDAPPTPMSSAKTACSEAHASAEDSKDSSEGDYYEAKAQMEDERSRRNTATRRRNKSDMQADNNILLFGQWFRNKQSSSSHASTQPAADAALKTPQMADLRAFVLDRNAYWGDEIALRVFADAFKLVVCVVLQVEERLQVVFPPNGGARSLFYLVLTHRGAVPHYRSVSVGDRHVLPLEEMLNVGCDGAPYVTCGMIGRLWEDCPLGWDEYLSPKALAFFMGRSQTKMSTIRHSIVRNAQTLREVKSDAAIEEQCNAGTAVQSWVIDGFPAGTGFVERIVCSRNETNPAFTISKTPGDGDCLFYSMIDVATEILQRADLHPAPGPSPELHALRQSFSKVDVTTSKHLVTVAQLRQMVSDSLTQDELAFFNAANNFC